MRILKLALPLALVCLLAAACSSDSDSGGSMTATPAATTVIAEDLPQPTEAGDGLSALQRAVADKIAASYATEVAVTDEQARCTAERSTAGFSDARLSELGISAAAIPDRGFTWGNYDLTTPEASTVVDATLECMDRMNLATAFLASHGYSLDEATCMADALANDEEALRTLITQTLVGDEESASTILSPLIEGCIDWRGFLAEMLVAEGISPESAECVAQGMSDEAFQVMLSGQEPEGDEGVIELFGELLELQNRCLTLEEIESMNGFGFQPGGPIPEGSIGTGACPPADGSGPTVLYFDGPQPMCLDASKQYTAVFDTNVGEMRIDLDMVNTPITANNFAVLALHGYYDDTLLFRTDPSIGIIQGGAPHTNSPSDPGPGYTIPDEGTGFTYEPGQIVMARTAAPNSASAQFFFAVNENTALLNSQGTYVVFGQMDEASLAVAEAILASHVDQPDNPLGGGPEPPVVVNSVAIEETG